MDNIYFHSPVVSVSPGRSRDCPCDEFGRLLLIATDESGYTSTHHAVRPEIGEDFPQVGEMFDLGLYRRQELFYLVDESHNQAEHEDIQGVYDVSERCPLPLHRGSLSSSFRAKAM